MTAGEEPCSTATVEDDQGRSGTTVRFGCKNGSWPIRIAAVVDDDRN